jgi:hypothetical protein
VATPKSFSIFVEPKANAWDLEIFPPASMAAYIEVNVPRQHAYEGFHEQRTHEMSNLVFRVAHVLVPGLTSTPITPTPTMTPWERRCTIALFSDSGGPGSLWKRRVNSLSTTREICLHSSHFPCVREWSGRIKNDTNIRGRKLRREKMCLRRTSDGDPKLVSTRFLDFSLQRYYGRDYVGTVCVNNKRHLSLWALVRTRIWVT